MLCQYKTFGGKSVITDYGYDFFLRTGRLSWSFDPELGTLEDWKKRMLQDGTWGDEVFLVLASNILQVDLIIIPCFRESSVHQGLGFTLIKSFERPKHLPLYLFSFSESDFNPAHYISVLPNNPKENVILTYWMEKKPAHDRQFKIFSPSRVIPRQQTGAQ